MFPMSVTDRSRIPATLFTATAAEKSQGLLIRWMRFEAFNGMESLHPSNSQRIYGEQCWKPSLVLLWKLKMQLVARQFPALEPLTLWECFTSRRITLKEHSVQS